MDLKDGKLFTLLIDSIGIFLQFFFLVAVVDAILANWVVHGKLSQ